jgi:hypothetical protein
VISSYITGCSSDTASAISSSYITDSPPDTVDFYIYKQMYHR